ncbi:hypothetical protein WICMUC_002818 [Wickerhamomyces mucosus]|uniref:Pre-rRNA-processing protein TSR2 n=1 Tax=Wickerhamomyces mucosus TaxID=1378264 RepID=A0A9P8PPB7_9ASCO|nr:hypothetical protein WICMUC_002818 [Wickerhamomyces mucosus]
MVFAIDASAYVEAQEGAKSLKFQTEKQQANFELGVSLMVHSWNTLDTAVVNGWGGPQSAEKRDWISSIVIDLFDEKLVDIDMIEETLLNAMIDEFDVHVEDDSSLAIADKILEVYKQCFDESYDEIHAIYDNWKASQENRSLRNATHIHVGEDPDNPDTPDEDEYDDDSEADNNVPQLTEDFVMDDATPEPQGPIVDEDGFELVQKKGKKRY